METPYFEILADFYCVHVGMWWIGPYGPSALLATKKASFGNKTCRLAIPLIIGQDIADFSKKHRFLLLWVKQGVFWVKNGVFSGVLTECEVANRKQSRE